MALAYALCKKSELTPELQQQAINAALQLRDYRDENATSTFILTVEKAITAPEAIGSEVTYPQKKQYDPGWKIGDTFSHRLTTPNSRNLGLSGSLVLLRKIGSYQDAEGNLKQIVCLTLCAADCIPKDSEELNALGLLPMMKDNGHYKYWGQLSLTSKRKEKSFAFEQNGNYPSIPIPKDGCDKDPRLARPLFGTIVKGSSYPASLEVEDYPCYEDDICLCYRMFGVKKGIDS